ncbi:PAS domain-containing protein [Isoptericola sp. NPDC057391]|uniref:PAS domain-containing protein n=1 Tax=Isoptericola sp. NPDC057391 TaxID=3346117 RepID=UPI00363ABA93
MVPTTALLLAHKHTEDRNRVHRMLRQAQVHGAPFSSVHQIMDARGEEKTLALVGEGVRDAAGQVVGLVGFFVDVTEVIRHRADARDRRHPRLGG